jgi:hypothetical protein
MIRTICKMAINTQDDLPVTDKVLSLEIFPVNKTNMVSLSVGDEFSISVTLDDLYAAVDALFSSRPE